MNQQASDPYLIWLYSGNLESALDAATWLETTRELRNMGWKVTLVATGSSGSRSIGDTEVYCIPMPGIYLLRQVIFHFGFYFLILQKGLNADIILFGQMSALWFLPVRLIRNLMRKRHPLLVLDIRSLHMDSEKQGVRGWLRGEYQNMMRRVTNYWVDGYLTITSRMANYLQISEDLLWGIWPSGVNLELFNDDQHDRHWPSNNDPVRLIYIGALHVERNLMVFCQAVERANADGMKFELDLFGKGDEYKELEEFASHTQNRIRVNQPVPHRQIPLILAQSHIGILPFPDEIKFQVSSPIKLFEYMAAGMPILATRINCHTDVIGNGNYVFWAESSKESGLLDALRLVWQNRETLKDLGSRAAIAAQAWTWRESAAKLKQSLEYGLKRNPV